MNLVKDTQSNHFHAGSLTKMSEMKWVAPFDNLERRSRRKHKSTYKFSNLYLCLILIKQQKTKLFCFSLPVKSQPGGWNCSNETCMVFAAACCNYPVMLGTPCTAALVSSERWAPLLDWNSLSFPSRVPVSSYERQRKKHDIPCSC